MKTKPTKSSAWHPRRQLRSARFAILGALLSATAAAETPDIEKAALRLPAQKLADLQREVARARAVDPKAFMAVSNIVARAPEDAMRARDRKAPTAHAIAQLGPSAVLPALEMIALAPPNGLPASIVPVVRRNLVEAVGILRDVRGVSVLSTIVESDDEEVDTVRTASEALARIGTDDAADELVSTLRVAPPERARAIVAGMGECRRLRVTQAIADRLSTTKDEATARVAARALGRAGNAWAWQTASDRTEETPIREAAARALVAAYVRERGEGRDAASNALMVVDSPQTPGLITAAKGGASDETVRALDKLAARFARNPSRVR